MRQDLLDRINQIAKSLDKASKWKNSEDAFGHIVIDDRGTKKIAEDNYIYEFYCLMKIIEDLNKRTNHEIKFKNENGIFPKKPASKNNRPYFILEVDGKEIFQICSGTNIQTKLTNVTKAPDISFQTMESDSILPLCKDILAIYDAKYSDSKSAKSYQEGQMALFNRMIRLLELEKPKSIEKYLTDYFAFSGNCILTNGKSYTTDVNELKEEMITAVEDFDIGKTFNVIK